MSDIYFIISIDVEPDCSPSWHYSNPLTFKGVHEGIGKILQPFFNRFDVKPTYLINNVVLEDDQSICTFKKLPGEFELAAHLHPEFILPEKAFDNYAGKKGEANCCFYPAAIEFEKIKNITQLFKDQFGYSPTSFRAGRFSAGKNTIESLVKLGYWVDTSVTPHINWADKTREKPVDYRRADEQPYWIKPGDYLEKALEGKTVLEVPVTIDFQKRFLRKATPKWLRPVYSSVPDVKRIIDNYQKRYKGAAPIVFNMMFHNVEVIPGISPYVQSQEEAKQYLSQIQYFIEQISGIGGKSVGLSDLYHIF